MQQHHQRFWHLSSQPHCYYHQTHNLTLWCTSSATSYDSQAHAFRCCLRNKCVQWTTRGSGIAPYNHSSRRLTIISYHLTTNYTSVPVHIPAVESHFLYSQSHMLPSGRPLYKTYFNEIICGRLQNGVARVLVYELSSIFNYFHIHKA